MWAEASCDRPLWTPPADGVALTNWLGIENPGSTSNNTGPGTYRATVAALNNRPAVQMPGPPHTASVYAGGVPNISQPYTYVIIWNYSSLAAAGVLCATRPTTISGIVSTAVGVFTAGGPYLQRYGANTTGGTPTTGGHFAVAVGNGSSSRLTVDGTTVIGPVSSGTASSGAELQVGAFQSGSTISTPMSGHFALFGRVPGLLTAPQEAALLAWSRSHYGTP